MAVTSDYVLTVTQVDGQGDFAPDNSLAATLNLKAYPAYTTAIYPDTALGNGAYKWLNLASGIYKVYNSATELTNFGLIRHGEYGAAIKADNETISGNWTFSGENTFSNATSPIKTNKIVPRTGSAITVAGVQLNTDLDTSDIVTKSTNQSITGDKDFLGDIIFSAGVETATAPTLADHITNKQYVDAQIAAINVSPLQQGSNIRRIIYGGVEEPGKVYSTVANALTSIGATTATSRFIIDLEKGQSDSNYSNIYQVSHAALTAISPLYLTIAGRSRADTHLLLGSTSDSTTLTSANLIFENMTIYLSNNDLAGARSYNSITFDNCNIFAYENLTLASCKMTNCRIWSATSKTVTISGVGHWLGCYFTATVTESGTVYYTSYVDGLDSTPTMPTEPDLGA